MNYMQMHFCKETLHFEQFNSRIAKIEDKQLAFNLRGDLIQHLQAHK